MVNLTNNNIELQIGYAGFNNLREKIAFLTAKDIGEHYRNLKKAPRCDSPSRKQFFKDYNEKISFLDKKYNYEYENILDFLYACNCGGTIDLETCKDIYNIIKDCKNNDTFSKDCTFEDFKNLLKDCIEKEIGFEWY